MKRHARITWRAQRMLILSVLPSCRWRVLLCVVYVSLFARDTTSYAKNVCIVANNILGAFVQLETGLLALS